MENFTILNSIGDIERDEDLKNLLNVLVQDREFILGCR